jgi:hypothetical protein
VSDTLRYKPFGQNRCAVKEIFERHRLERVMTPVGVSDKDQSHLHTARREGRRIV